MGAGGSNGHFINLVVIKIKQGVFFFHWTYITYTTNNDIQQGFVIGMICLLDTYIRHATEIE